MLVRSIRPFRDYTGTREIPQNILFVVYAKAIDSAKKHSYYVYPLGKKNDSQKYDPLFFDADNFEVIGDVVSQNWITKEVEFPEGDVQYSSFPEWFENDFHIRAHDWDLSGKKDYGIIRKYKKEYEELYKQYLK
jgi:hypothetical protein